MCARHQGPYGTIVKVEIKKMRGVELDQMKDISSMQEGNKDSDGEVRGFSQDVSKAWSTGQRRDGERPYRGWIAKLGHERR